MLCLLAAAIQKMWGSQVEVEISRTLDLVSVHKLNCKILFNQLNFIGLILSFFLTYFKPTTANIITVGISLSRI